MNLKNLSLLFVEDDTYSQDWMKMAFEDEFGAFYQAKDGLEAIEMYKTYKPDVIITDIHMPKLDGLSMAQRIKAIDPAQQIIIISAFDDKKTLLRAIEIGIDYFIAKPIEISNLLQKLKQIAQILQDRADAKKYKEHRKDKLACLEFYDETTQVPNKMLFLAKLETLLEHSVPFTLLYIAPHRFDTVLEQYSHDFKEAFLRFIVSTIRHTIQTYQVTFLARIDAYTFAVIIEDTVSIDTLRSQTHRMLQALFEEFCYENEVLQHPFNAAIAVYNPNETQVTKQTLLEATAAALISASDQGADTFEIATFSS